MTFRHLSKLEHLLTRSFWILSALLCLSGCEPIGPGERTLYAPATVPNAKDFATKIQPLLLDSCAAASCHGRNTTFHLSTPRDPIDVGRDYPHPNDLPEPTKTNCFVVLAFSNADLPSESLLIKFGTGRETSHPGKNAFSSEDALLVQTWLEGGNLSP
jgi:hypothetical protein